MIKYVLSLTLLFILTSNLQAGIVILNGLTHTYQTDKGQVYKGKIEIQNTGSGPKTVKLYLQDLTYQSDGTSYYTAPYTNKKTNANWIKINSNLINLKEKEKTEVYYEVTVPDSITQAGSYWSTIIVEPVEDIIPNNDKGGVQITSIVRYAIQIITDYSTENLKSNLLFKQIDVVRDEQQKLLKVALANTGLVYCRPIVSIELYDIKSGEKIDHLFSQPMGLLPSTSKSYLIDVNRVPAGKYKAVLYAVDQEQNTFALQVELEI